MLKTTFNAKIRYLEVNKQDEKYQSFVSRLTFNKELPRIVFRCYNASSRVFSKIFIVFKDINKGTGYYLRRCQTLSEPKLVYLEIKWKEAKFD